MQIALTPENEEALKAFTVFQGVGNPTGWGNKAIAEFLRLHSGDWQKTSKKGNQNGRRKGRTT